jgi:hypothetical protein
VFTLATGAWNLLVKAYPEPGPHTNLAATGSASFTVSQDATPNITVNLDPIRGAGKGTLTFRVTYPSGATFDKLSWVSLSNTDPDVDLKGVSDYASGPAGSPTVTTGSLPDRAAGQYLITALMKNKAGVRTAGKTEVVHIYQNLPTAVAFTFVPSDFTAPNGSIIIVFDEPGAARVYNQWEGANVKYTLTDSDGNPKNPAQKGALSGDVGEFVPLSVIAGDILVLEEVTPNTSFRSWRPYGSWPLVENVSAHVTAMPPMDAFTKAGSAGAEAGENFFYSFNNGGSLTSLPEGSFDISKITTAGNKFFGSFNSWGALTSLPEGSFNTSSISTAGDDFFSWFNSHGSALTSLPAGSFNTSSINEAGNNFFGDFNYGGALTKLPKDSFDISNITTVGRFFFGAFNTNGDLTELPVGSFNTSSIDEVGAGFFDGFNNQGALTELPKDSFDISNITTANISFFANFNYNGGALTKLPEGSFNISSSITFVDDENFFKDFNADGGKLQKVAGGNPINKSGSDVTAYYYLGSPPSAVVRPGDPMGYAKPKPPTP